MKTLTMAEQVNLFAAAAVTFSAVESMRPVNPHALAAAGLVTAALAPTWPEMVAYRASAGLPPLDELAYDSMLASARAFAVSIATSGETEH